MRWSPRARRIAGVILVLGCVQALAVMLYRSVKNRKEPESASAFEVQQLGGDPAPPIDLRNADNRRVRWEDLRGAPVLVHFWASWCTPCRKEIPALLEIARTHRGNLHVLAISLDEDWSPVRLFFKGSIPDQVCRLVDSQAQRRYGVTTLPDTFVASSSGKLIARLSGTRDWSSSSAGQWLSTWQKANP